ncbi:MAG TPA: hypothetical protein VGF45_04790, partial [Polyangia bacterium]
MNRGRPATAGFVPAVGPDAFIAVSPPGAADGSEVVALTGALVTGGAPGFDSPDGGKISALGAAATARGCGG